MRKWSETEPPPNIRRWTFGQKGADLARVDSKITARRTRVGIGAGAVRRLVAEGASVAFCDPDDEHGQLVRVSKGQ